MGQAALRAVKAMKRYLTRIVAAELLFATGNLHANEVEVEVPGLLTDHTVFDRTPDSIVHSATNGSRYTGNPDH